MYFGKFNISARINLVYFKLRSRLNCFQMVVYYYVQGRNLKKYLSNIAHIALFRNYIVLLTC